MCLNKETDSKFSYIKFENISQFSLILRKDSFTYGTLFKQEEKGKTTKNVKKRCQ